jgi:hypothetical protein
VKNALRVLVGVLALSATNTSTTLGAIASCQRYDEFFEDAAVRLHIPSNLLRAIAAHESGCEQNARNRNGDGGCGVMQLTDQNSNTRTTAATLLSAMLGVTVMGDDLCAPEGSQLNILGGAAVLDSYKCWASPRVFSDDPDFSLCRQGVTPYALRADEEQLLSETLEPWWFPVVRYNGGGEDGAIFTSNYPFRVWHRFKDVINGISISYPPLPSISYCLEGEALPNCQSVAYRPGEVVPSDDGLYPTPSQLGRPGVTGGIRWVKPDLNAFTEIVPLHRNDGSEYIPVAGLPCHLYTPSSSSTPSPFTAGFGVPWNFFTRPPNELVLQASCSAAGVTAQIHKPSSIQSHLTYHQGYQWNAPANQWQYFFYTCTQPLIANVWCPDNATATLNLLHPFFIAYTCSLVNNQWKCGCRDEQCAQGFWQLQQFQR